MPSNGTWLIPGPLRLAGFLRCQADLSLCVKNKKEKRKTKQVRLLGDGNKAGCAACAVFCGLVYSLNWHNCRWAHSWDEHPLWLRGVFQSVPAKVQNDLFHSTPFPSWGGINSQLFSRTVPSHIFDATCLKFCLVLIEIRPRWVMWKLSSRFLFMTEFLFKQHRRAFKWLCAQTADSRPANEFSRRKTRWKLPFVAFFILWYNKTILHLFVPVMVP